MHDTVTQFQGQGQGQWNTMGGNFQDQSLQNQNLQNQSLQNQSLQNQRLQNQSLQNPNVQNPTNLPGNLETVDSDAKILGQSFVRNTALNVAQTMNVLPNTGSTSSGSSDAVFSVDCIEITDK